MFIILSLPNASSRQGYKRNMHFSLKDTMWRRVPSGCFSVDSEHNRSAEDRSCIRSYNLVSAALVQMQQL